MAKKNTVEFVDCIVENEDTEILHYKMGDLHAFVDYNCVTGNWIEGSVSYSGLPDNRDDLHEILTFTDDLNKLKRDYEEYYETDIEWKY